MQNCVGSSNASSKVYSRAAIVHVCWLAFVIRGICFVLLKFCHRKSSHLCFEAWPLLSTLPGDGSLWHFSTECISWAAVFSWKHQVWILLKYCTWGNHFSVSILFFRSCRCVHTKRDIQGSAQWEIIASLRCWELNGRQITVAAVMPIYLQIWGQNNWDEIINWSEWMSASVTVPSLESASAW